jgi:class 3 adenylate cyclase
VRCALGLSAEPVGQSELCIGIGFGRILQLDDDAFGDEVNLAYKLGEDIAKGREILITASAAERTSAQMEGPLHTTIGGLDIPYFRLLR